MFKECQKIIFYFKKIDMADLLEILLTNTTTCSL